MKIYDSIIIGGGQAGISVAYFFRRHKISDYIILDDQPKAGGSWHNTWDSLTLFSPVQYSTLSGWMMPQGPNMYPLKDEFINYLKAYEERYDLPIARPVTVESVEKEGNTFIVNTNKGIYRSKTLVSATGNYRNPFIPSYPNIDAFEGVQIHSSEYKRPDRFKDQKVIVVGGGNSGAQVIAEVSKVADTQWVTLEPPEFLPDHIDGRHLFQEVTSKSLNTSSQNEMKFSLGNIVMIDSVKEAFNRGVLNARRPFRSFYDQGVVWSEEEKEVFDSVIWCTGYRSNLKHLELLNVIENNRIEIEYTRSKAEPNLWLVGYGNWTGFASATIYGVGKTARNTAREISEALIA